MKEKTSHESRIIRHPFKKFIPSRIECCRNILLSEKAIHILRERFGTTIWFKYLCDTFPFLPFWVVQCDVWLVDYGWLCRHSITDQCNFCPTPTTKTFFVTFQYPSLLCPLFHLFGSFNELQHLVSLRRYDFCPTPKTETFFCVQPISPFGPPLLCHTVTITPPDSP